MNASRILPTVAFSVAVSFFFIPPVVAVIKSTPAQAKPAAVGSLIVASEPIQTLPVRAKAAQNQGVCSPAEPSASTTSSGRKRGPWNPWIVASLDAR